LTRGVSVTFLVAFLLSALGLLVAGCSDSKAPTPTDERAVTTTGPPIPVGQAPLLIEMIRPAIAAVEAELGGPQQFFEVNATPTLVNLFVAESNATMAVAYVYQTGVLQPPADAQLASGPTFASVDLTFDETRVLANAIGALPTSTFRAFSAVGVQGGGVSYLVTIESALGGQLEVTVGPTGAILGTNEQVIPSATTTGS
jgi:hypothetical protein